ncbi:MAG: site-specific integrase [Vagococcus sp.]|jgi:integrase|nr:site-specific integrase [Vagococcus sp.]
MYDIKEVLSKINNAGYKVKLNYKKENGKYVLFLNYRTSVNKVTKQSTKRVVTLTGDDKKEDLLRVKKADLYRNEFEKSILKENNVFYNAGDKTLLSDYCDYIGSRFTNYNSNKVFRLLKQHLIKFAGSHITIAQVNKSFCSRFIDYLKKENLKADHFYFGKFKQVLYKAIAEELISDLPFLRQMSIKKNTPVREFLTIEELSKVYKLNTKYVDFKNAFIFACYTGLRFIDLFNLKFSDIKDNVLFIKQQKTNEILNIPLHTVAKDILLLQKESQGNEINVFNLKCYNRWQEYIKKIISDAGITKNISGHCARHTFATLCITQGIDIYTVSKLLGHTDVKHTQIYAKLIDKKKDEAIDKLPSL